MQRMTSISSALFQVWYLVDSVELSRAPKDTCEMGDMLEGPGKYMLITIEFSVFTIDVTGEPYR